jgi:hypothetical protein
VLAAWAAYHSTRWSGVQADSYSVAAARRTEATQANSTYAALAQIDVQSWLTWLEQKSAGNEKGTEFLRARFREEFRPAFDAWLAQVPPGEVPPGTPFQLPQYAPAEKARAERLNAEADAFAAEAREANQIGDDFVLSAVIMAAVLFFAGIGTRFRGRGVRLAMLAMAVLLFVGGTIFIFAMPQNVGI